MTVLSSSLFSTSLLNTVLFTIGSIIGQFVIGLALAIFFQRKFPLNGILRSLLLLPWLLPLIVSSAVWRWILDKDSGALNRFLGDLGIIDTGIPWLTSTSLALIAVVGGEHLDRHPVQPDHPLRRPAGNPGRTVRGRITGRCHRLEAFRHITWPMLRPVVSVVLVLGVVYTLKVLDIILGLTNGGPANSTRPSRRSPTTSPSTNSSSVKVRPWATCW